MTRLLRCVECGAVVDPSDFPEWELLRFHKEPLPGGCGGPLVPLLPGPVGG